MTPDPDTICAVATPAGRGGVGIVRVSGPDAPGLAERVAGRLPEPRVASLAAFRDADGAIIDRGILLYFPGPHSFTGEHVLELQAHGGPVLLQMLMERLVALGARAARPGEFSERAFLNGRMDLAQAEAVADLIDSATERAARAAARSLDGAFSGRVQGLFETLTDLRTFVEAAIDFPDEEIEFIQDAHIGDRLDELAGQIRALGREAHQGRLLRDGLTVVIAGPPNSGKSSLLNALAGTDAAIVTDIPGTTRDMLREQIQIRGMPIHVVDTAGLRDSTDLVEREGVKRAEQAMGQADRVLYIHEAGAEQAPSPPELGVPVTVVRNKIDLTGEAPGIEADDAGTTVSMSVKTGAGLDLLRDHLGEVAGLDSESQGVFSARARHLEALERVNDHLARAREQLEAGAGSELVAEELRLAQHALGEITGEFTADDLLGRIFSSFCIGK